MKEFQIFGKQSSTVKEIIGESDISQDLISIECTLCVCVCVCVTLSHVLFPLV